MERREPFDLEDWVVTALLGLLVMCPLATCVIVAHIIAQAAVRIWG